MTDTTLFGDARDGEDGRRLAVTAEHGYGSVIILKVGDDGGETAIFIHDANEAIWLGEALVKAGRAVLSLA